MNWSLDVRYTHYYRVYHNSMSHYSGLDLDDD